MNVKFLIVGILVVAVGAFLLYPALRNALKCKGETEGTIVSVERKRSNRKNDYYPVMEFTAGGKTIRKTADISSRFSTKFKEGSTLMIKYNEDDPEEFFIKGKSFRSNFFGGLFVVAVGVIMIVFSLQK